MALRVLVVGFFLGFLSPPQLRLTSADTVLRPSDECRRVLKKPTASRVLDTGFEMAADLKTFLFDEVPSKVVALFPKRVKEWFDSYEKERTVQVETLRSRQGRDQIDYLFRRTRSSWWSHYSPQSNKMALQGDPRSFYRLLGKKAALVFGFYYEAPNHLIVPGPRKFNRLIVQFNEFLEDPQSMIRVRFEELPRRPRGRLDDENMNYIENFVGSLPAEVVLPVDWNRPEENGATLTHDVSFHYASILVPTSFFLLSAYQMKIRREFFEFSESDHPGWAPSSIRGSIRRIRVSAIDAATANLMVYMKDPLRQSFLRYSEFPYFLSWLSRGQSPINYLRHELKREVRAFWPSKDADDFIPFDQGQYSRLVRAFLDDRGSELLESYRMALSDYPGYEKFHQEGRRPLPPRLVVKKTRKRIRFIRKSAEAFYNLHREEMQQRERDYQDLIRQHRERP